MYGCCIVSGITPVAVLVFEEPEDPSSRNFFSEIISSVSDVKFSHNGRYLVTRDYLNIKVDSHVASCLLQLFVISAVHQSSLFKCFCRSGICRWNLDQLKLTRYMST